MFYMSDKQWKHFLMHMGTPMRPWLLPMEFGCCSFCLKTICSTCTQYTMTNYIKCFSFWLLKDHKPGNNLEHLQEKIQQPRTKNHWSRKNKSTEDTDMLLKVFIYLFYYWIINLVFSFFLFDCSFEQWCSAMVSNDRAERIFCDCEHKVITFCRCLKEWVYGIQYGIYM